MNYNLNIISVVEYSCKECGELKYLNSRSFWNKTDFGTKCENCETVNRIILENGELKK